ncbi:SDR family oxidoreductase [Marivita sp. GX14005]|uniref:SDR family oxidoreductase n=1 Tax=Marivita sp. GX14005 TaxID=2942276 RepID=UPI002019D352|nr:SDR family oxidoreductase [Marivita sp. GX14005]MCL3881728.1 SDR family oxidoreductase [Marivita sp. GX14005]
MSETGKQRVLILGGRSDIGLAIARRFAADGHPITLAARNAQTLEDDKADIALRNAVEVSVEELDVLDTEAMAAFVAKGAAPPGIVVSVIGVMGDQHENQRVAEQAALVMRTNYEAPALALGLYAELMEAAGEGVLVGVSSVAGDRGRGSNYVYGSAKAGFTAYLSGLRNRLSGKGVHVVTVKPGFVATRMTDGMDLPQRLVAQPEEVAEAIWHAVEKRRDVVYVKPVWRWIMGIIGMLPERVFKKTSL